MYIEEFNECARILGKKHVPEVIRELMRKDWIKANELASYIGITTATAVTYLRSLSKVGLLDKRRAKGLTGKVWEYRLDLEEYCLKLDLK